MDCKWIFTMEYNADGVDYKEKFALMEKTNTIKSSYYWLLTSIGNFCSMM